MSNGESRRGESSLTWLALFTSAGTLICCALPIGLVTLGFGAAVASLTSSFPLLVTLSQHKNWAFAFSALMLILAAWVLYRPGRACPTDPVTGTLCSQVQIWNRRIYWFSVVTWSVGFFAAYLALPLQLWIES